MDTSLFFSFMGSLIICMALIPALTASAGRLQFVDVPRERHAHDAPIAKIGGIAFGIATIAAVLLWAPKDQLILSSLLGGAVIVLFGAWDDRVNLTPRMKFVGQVLAAAIVIGLAGVRLTAVPFVDDDDIDGGVVDLRQFERTLRVERRGVDRCKLLARGASPMTSAGVRVIAAGQSPKG